MNERHRRVVREHLEAALAANEGGEPAYHLRAALQYLVTPDGTDAAAPARTD